MQFHLTQDLSCGELDWEQKLGPKCKGHWLESAACPPSAAGSLSEEVAKEPVDKSYFNFEKLNTGDFY